MVTKSFPVWSLCVYRAGSCPDEQVPVGLIHLLKAWGMHLPCCDPEQGPTPRQEPQWWLLDDSLAALSLLPNPPPQAGIPKRSSPLRSLKGKAGAR